MNITPAQADGHPNFVTDVPVQGPTDEGMRAASCWFAQNRLPAHPACVDCKGPIPMWTRHPGLLGEMISYGGRPLGLSDGALGAAGDPEVWTKLSTDQQKWVVDSLTMLNNLIYQATGTRCATWGPSITAAGGCFQGWFNANSKLTRPDGSPMRLRTDGTFDQDTLDALVTTAAMDPGHFPKPYPAAALAEKKKLSTGAMAGIAVAGAAVVGGLIYVATKKPSRRRR